MRGLMVGMLFTLAAAGLVAGCAFWDSPKLTSAEVVAIVKNRLSDKTHSKEVVVEIAQSPYEATTTVTRTCLEETLAQGTSRLESIQGTSRWESSYVGESTWAVQYVTLTGLDMSGNELLGLLANQPTLLAWELALRDAKEDFLADPPDPEHFRLSTQEWNVSERTLLATWVSEAPTGCEF